MRVTIVTFIISLLIMKHQVLAKELESKEESSNEKDEISNSEDLQSEEREEKRDSTSPQIFDNANDENPMEDDALSSTSQPERQVYINSLHKVNEAAVPNFHLHRFGKKEDVFSFHKLVGPLSKDVKEVLVPNSNPRQPGSYSTDYMGKPDYSFAYGVHDGLSKNSHTHEESRNGNALRGEYRVLQPDGLVRIVQYTADPTSGFKMSVVYAKI